MKIVFIVSIILLFEVHHGTGDEMYFTASEMKDVVEFERIIGPIFLEFYKRESERLDRLEEFLMDKEATHEQVKAIGKDKVVSNPTDLYKLMKRLLTEWDDFEWMYTAHESKKNLELLALYEKSIFAFKEGKEHRGSFQSIFKLQDTYKISVGDMVNGLSDPSHTLDLDDMFEIASYANHFWAYPKAIEWSTYIIEQFDTTVDVNVGNSMLSDVYDILSWASYKIRDYSAAIDACRTSISLNFTHTRQYNLQWYQQLQITQAHPADTTGIPQDDPENNKTLQAVRCRREEKLDQKYADTLFCQHYTPHPQFYLKPLKQERLYHDPQIDLYHDILSENEVNHLKEQGRTSMNLAKVYSFETGKLTTAGYRTSKSTWLYPLNDPTIVKIMKRIGALGNFDMTYSEPLQVANYGIGGNYEAHYDFAAAPFNSSIFGAYDFGDRLATMLFYLETVEEGGDTTFINVLPGVSTQAVKGSGVFWHNLKKNGKGDLRTKHAACPVLLGEKWISNLWIHEHGQEFRHPCSLNPDE